MRQKKLGPQPSPDLIDEKLESESHEASEKEAEKKRMKAMMLKMLKLAGEKGKKE